MPYGTPRSGDERIARHELTYGCKSCTPPERHYQNQAVTPYSSNDILVNDPTFSNSADECGAVTGERVTVSMELYCNTWILDCTGIVELRGAINETDTFPIAHNATTTKSYGFTMPSSDVTLDIDVYEGDVLLDDKCGSFSYNIRNVTQEEKDTCTPIVPPIDISKIDLTSILIGSSIGGVAGMVMEGKSGAIQFGLIGGVVALAYTYLTSTQK